MDAHLTEWEAVRGVISPGVIRFSRSSGSNYDWTSEVMNRRMYGRSVEPVGAFRGVDPSLIVFARIAKLRAFAHNSKNSNTISSQ